jgi:hypothetical protein
MLIHSSSLVNAVARSSRVYLVSARGSPQHRLNFLPLPQGQRSFAPELVRFAHGWSLLSSAMRGK